MKGGAIRLEDRLERARVNAGGANHPVPGGMLETAENVRREYGIPRDEQDELALRSHERAVAAQSSGAFAEEIVPVATPGGDVVNTDEHPRADTTLEALGRLRAVMGASDPDATVTAGNSSGQNDGVRGDAPGQGVRARPAAAGAGGVVGGGGRGARDDGHRPGSVDVAGAGACGSDA